MRRSLIALIACISGPALAADKPSPRPEVFTKLVECRAIVDNVARLECFDRQAAVLDAAERNAEVVVVDRQQVRKVGKTLFGLPVPAVGSLFGRDDKQQGVDDITQIESTLKSVSTTTYGKLVFVLEDGARWVQTESISIRTPKAGQLIKIKKAALGSFFASVNGQPGIRVRRDQ